ncbi:MAG: hypothetical protein ACRDHK_09610 [Actinomycetota bacterium]
MLPAEATCCTPIRFRSTYDELGADFFERRTNTEARQRQLVRQLEALGHRVTLEPAA